MKELAFSLTKKDFVVEHIRGSGPGGQHRNKSSTGVRITHPASGAVGTATDNKSQKINQRNALKRLSETKTFKLWVKLRVAEMARDGETIEQAVEKQMNPSNLRVEVEKNGKWTVEGNS